MPIRPREHEVEQLSINAFDRALPRNWQPRAKSSDYGVDREVEIFDLDGNATGYVFNVQLKGTDDIDKYKTVQIRTDTVQYLCNLDIPAIIVRYCDPRQTLYWMWAFEALDQIRSGTETVKLNFSDDRLWTSATAEIIERALKAIRRVKSRDRRSRFKMVPAHDLGGSTAIRVRRLVNGIIERINYGVFENSEAAIPINIGFIRNRVVLEVKGVIDVVVPANLSNDRDCLSAITYGLVDILTSNGFDIQAEYAAAACHRHGMLAPTPELAAKAAASLIARPLEAVEFAIMNGLHRNQDLGFNMFLMALVGPRNASADTNDAITRYYHAAIAAHLQRGLHVGNLWYNLANRLRSMRSYGDAIGAYNRARKAQQEYMDRAYFSKEIGGVLFNLRRFSCSAKAYRRSIELSSNVETRFLFADALMFGKAYEAAALEFDALSEIDGTLGAESRLRGYVSHWLSGGKNVPHSTAYEDLIAFRAKCQKIGDRKSLFLSQLALTFFEFDTDYECWGEAIFFCILSGTLEALRDTLTCASYKCGLEAFQFFKDRQLPNLKLDVDAIELFENLALEVQDEVEAEREISGPEYTLRMS